MYWYSYKADLLKMASSAISWGIYLWSSPHKHLLHKTFLTTPDSIPFSEVNALLNNEMIAQYTMCFHTFYIWLTIKK